MELLVIIGILSLLAVLVLGVVGRVRAASSSVRCMANLHSIAVGFNQYAVNNEQQYPAPVAAGQSWESMLQPYIGQKYVFACPADTEIYPAVGSSYDWRDTPDPLTSLVGRRVTDGLRPDAVLAFETLPGWHGKHTMNALRINGSVAAMPDDQCLLDLQSAVSSLLPSGLP